MSRRRQSGVGVNLVADAPGASPQSLEKAETLKGNALYPYRNPEKGDGYGTSSRRDVLCVLGGQCFKDCRPARATLAVLKAPAVQVHAVQIL